MPSLLPIVLGLVCILPASAYAQGQVNQQAGSAREIAPIDLTGYWVSLVSEDWRVRMIMGQKGDWQFMNLNDEGIRLAEAADPANESPCKAYGAAGIMRIPARLHITWQGDSTLRIDTDAGIQTRLFHFDELQTTNAEPTRQGHSTAEWQNGELKVVTNRMLPGYYFKHGIPYSSDAVMTEYATLIPEDHGNDYLFFTTVVEDPKYLDGKYIRTLTFKGEPDPSSWNPTPCSVP